MKTTRFAPAEKIDNYIYNLKIALDRHGMTSDITREGNNIAIRTVRLKTAKPHTAPYDERYGGNYHLETVGGNLYGVNNYSPNIRVRIKRSKALNYDDWAVFNDAVNRLADRMQVTFNLQSSWKGSFIRQGETWGSW